MDQVPAVTVDPAATKFVRAELPPDPKSLHGEAMRGHLKAAAQELADQGQTPAFAELYVFVKPKET